MTNKEELLCSFLFIMVGLIYCLLTRDTELLVLDSPTIEIPKIENSQLNNLPYYSYATTNIEEIILLTRYAIELEEISYDPSTPHIYNIKLDQILLNPFFIAPHHRRINGNDLMILARIIDNEAGSASSFEETTCVSSVLPQRCNGPTTLGACLRRQISQWSPEFLRAGYQFRNKRRALFFALNYYRNGVAEYCEGFTHYFSPISMPPAPESLMVSPTDMCSHNIADNRRRQFFVNPENNRSYLCDRHTGFLYHMSVRGGYRYFENLGRRGIPSFAASEDFECDYDGQRGIDPNRFVFCRRV